MKLLIVLSIKEFREKVAELLQKSEVSRFSVIDMVGYKRNKRSPYDNWFGANADNAKTNSILLFSFTTKEKAENVIKSIDQCNEEVQNTYPVHAFVLDVEAFSNIL